MLKAEPSCAISISMLGIDSVASPPAVAHPLPRNDKKRDCATAVLGNFDFASLQYKIDIGVAGRPALVCKDVAGVGPAAILVLVGDSPWHSRVDARLVVHETTVHPLCVPAV